MPKYLNNAEAVGLGVRGRARYVDGARVTKLKPPPAPPDPMASTRAIIEALNAVALRIEQLNATQKLYVMDALKQVTASVEGKEYRAKKCVFTVIEHFESGPRIGRVKRFVAEEQESPK